MLPCWVHRKGVTLLGFWELGGAEELEDGVFCRKNAVNGNLGITHPVGPAHETGLHGFEIYPGASLALVTTQRFAS